LDLVLHSDESPVYLKDVARRQQISLPYLEHLITPLIYGHLVIGTVGPSSVQIREKLEIRLSCRLTPKHKGNGQLLQIKTARKIN